MSQFQSFESGMGPGPGPILSLTGDTGGAVGPDGSGNINVLGSTGNPIVPLGPNKFVLGTIVGSPGSNTLFVDPLNLTVSTIDDTPTVIYALTIPANQAVVISARIIGLRDDISACAGGEVVAIGRNNGVVQVTSAGQIVTDYVGNPPPTAYAIGSASILEIIVVGVAAENWDWTVAIQYQFQEA